MSEYTILVRLQLPVAEQAFEIEEFLPETCAPNVRTSTERWEFASEGLLLHLKRQERAGLLLLRGSNGELFAAIFGTQGGHAWGDVLVNLDEGVNLDTLRKQYTTSKGPEATVSSSAYTQVSRNTANGTAVEIRYVVKEGTNLAVDLTYKSRIPQGDTQIIGPGAQDSGRRGDSGGQGGSSGGQGGSSGSQGGSGNQGQPTGDYDVSTPVSKGGRGGTVYNDDAGASTPSTANRGDTADPQGPTPVVKGQRGGHGYDDDPVPTSSGKQGSSSGGGSGVSQEPQPVAKGGRGGHGYDDDPVPRNPTTSSGGGSGGSQAPQPVMKGGSGGQGYNDDQAPRGSDGLGDSEGPTPAVKGGRSAHGYDDDQAPTSIGILDDSGPTPIVKGRRGAQGYDDD